MISKNLARDVLNIALQTGGDFAEIYLEENISNSISLDNGKVEMVNSGITYGAGIRILNKLQSVYGYTNDISRKGLEKLAKTLSASYEGQPLFKVTNINKVRVPHKHKPKIKYSDISVQEKIERMKSASGIMQNYDPRIARTMVSFADNTKKVVIFNSEGKQFTDIRTRGRIYMTAIASKEGAIETSGVGPGAQKGMEFFDQELDLKELATEVAKTALIMLDAKECPSGKIPVIIGNGFGGVIFHEACGHPLEASSVGRGLSIFSGKEGQKIASDLVSAVDDGTIEGAWGSGNIDDEGNKTQRTLLIKNGILNDYMVDNFSGRRMGRPGNGCARRESYRYEPTSRMSNTFILPGKSTPEEIIKATKFGLYAKSLGGGSVNPTTGDFNFACTEAYIVKDGKIAYPVKGATLIGSGKDVLTRVDMVGNDIKRAQGMCGASSGSIPVDVGQPTIRLSEMTVGGRGGVIKQ